MQFNNNTNTSYFNEPQQSQAYQQIDSPMQHRNHVGLVFAMITKSVAYKFIERYDLMI